MAEKVASYFGDSFAEMSLAYEIKTIPLGTGGALRRALAHASSDHMFVSNGDTFLDLDVSRVETLWQARRLPVIVGKNIFVTHVTAGVRRQISGSLASCQKHDRPGADQCGMLRFAERCLDMFELGPPFSLEADFLPSAVKLPSPLWLRLSLLFISAHNSRAQEPQYR